VRLGGDQVYATGFTSEVMVLINAKGLLKRTYGSLITQPLGDVEGPTLYGYSAASSLGTPTPGGGRKLQFRRKR
jgi:hypothetical protein